MLRKKITLTALWAIGTFALAMALGFPATSTAVDDANAPGFVATILTPALTVNGVELTVTQDAAATQPSQSAGGRQLKFTVHAKNENSAAARGNFTIELTSAALSSPLARTLPIPTHFWTASSDFGLHSGETKDFEFMPPLLVPNRVFTLLLNSSGNQMAMLSMAEKSSGPITIP